MLKLPTRILLHLKRWRLPRGVDLKRGFELDFRGKRWGVQRYEDLSPGLFMSFRHQSIYLHARQVCDRAQLQRTVDRTAGARGDRKAEEMAAFKDLVEARLTFARRPRRSSRVGPWSRAGVVR